MALTINTNISAINTQRNLNSTNRMLNKSLEKLSSGYKINVASDDPSGLIISEQLRAQMNGLGRAVSNSQEASNVIGIAEGALIEMNSILRKMRSLALHAANSGVTAPDQIRADQSEVDSGIQTLDRIANTTRYSDQFLLNGSKGLVYSRTTTVDEPLDHPMLDLNNTRVDQIFKRDGSSLSISFNGTKSATQAEPEQMAKRAYFEADPSSSASIQIADGKVTADQSYTLTGNDGARQFMFASGTDLGSMVSAMNNVKDSTGVGATLIFDSAVTGVQAAANTLATRATTMPSFYNYDDVGNPETAAVGVTAVAAVDYTDVVPGLNIDGEGRMYIRFESTGSTNYIAYKDAAMTMEIGRGSTGTAMTASNNSGIGAAGITLTTSAAGTITEGDTAVIQLASQLEINNTNATTLNTNGMSDLSGMTSLAAATNLSVNNGSSALSGVRLGYNTDENGSLYYEIIDSGVAGADQVNIYKSSQMNQEDLVAQATGITLGAGSFRVFPVNMDGGTGASSGLYGTMTFTGAPGANGTYTGSMQFDQTGIRLYSTDYGSDQYVRIQNSEGQLFGQYQTPDSTNLELVEEGQTVQQFGQNASITVNGQPLGTEGLTANVTTPSYSGSLVFNEGTLGETTIAQVGQDIGSLYSRGTALQAVDEGTPDVTDLTFATNARHATNETLDEFIGGMQYQLGEGEGDQERTVYGIPSMVAANLGQVTIDGQTFNLQNVLAGGEASLANDPITALKVISKAVNDVSELRARLGAFQANMLQTNINSLEVAVEKITMTESAIRDTNMATATTEFTKNQILMQAGTSMLAQANQQGQTLLQLLG